MRGQFEEIIKSRPEATTHAKIEGFAIDWELTPRKVSDWYYGQRSMRRHELAAFVTYKSHADMIAAIDKHFS